MHRLSYFSDVVAFKRGGPRGGPNALGLRKWEYLKRYLENLLRVDRRPSLRRKPGTFCSSFVLALSLVGLAANQVAAQESIRASLSRVPITQFQVPKGPTFVTLGPFRGSASIGLGFTVDDNSDLSSTNAKSEAVFNQSLDLDLAWELSHLNVVDLRLGATLSEFLGGTNTQSVQLAIEPDSKIELKLVAGDFLFGFHNYFSIVQDPTRDAAAANQNNLNRLTNDAGVSADWYLSQLIVTARFDYSFSSDNPNKATGTTTSGSRNTLRPGLAAAYALTPNMNTGLEFFYSKSLSSNSANSITTVNGRTFENTGDVSGASVGPFLRGRLTRLITLDLAAGLYDVDAPHVKSIDYYLSFNISHQLSRFLQYIASFQRDLQFSTGTDLYSENRFTLGLRYQLRRNLTVGANGFAGWGRVFSGEFLGGFTQYGTGVGFNYALSRRITAGLQYQFIRREGSGGNGNYQQNRADFNVSYAF